MATSISPGERACDAVRHIAHRRLDPTVECLRLSGEADVDEVVHDVRRRCKRVRALLRLVRDELGDEVYKRENQALREAGRALSPLRDALVLIEVYDEVVGAGAMPVPGFRSLLIERHEKLRREVLEGDTLPAVRASLAAIVARIDTWPMTTVDWEVLGAGVKRVYRRARKAMAAAYDDPSTERFHQWRKRAKYLRHQLRYLEELWPDVLGGSARSTHDLTRVLGEEHDLAVLRRAVDAEAQDEALADFIASRRALLQAQARPIGIRLFAEKPSRFIARLGQYWEAGVRSSTAA